MTALQTDRTECAERFARLSDAVDALTELAAQAGCETDWLIVHNERLRTHVELHRAPAVDSDTASLVRRLGAGLLDTLYSNLRLIPSDDATSNAARVVLVDEVRHVEEHLRGLRELLAERPA
ncbi:MAG: hypothetical protein AB8G26_15655 [Ilumatobacter sp.]